MKNKNGGVRAGAGRKPKIDELSLIERLSPMEDAALLALKIGVESGEFPFVKLYMEYRYGKPKESIDHTTNGKDIANIINVGYSEHPENED